jgi:CheY-like chemotaxis protein
MEDVEELVNKICEKNNYDELLLEIVKKGKESNINRVLEEISNNTKLNDKEKKSYYDKIFDYVEDVNGSFENKIKDIYKRGVKEGLETMLMLSSKGEEKETLKKCLNDYKTIKKEESDMSKKIKIIIADDNVHICEFIRKFLEKYEDIEILGIANTDEDELKMIEKLKPEIVITDLMRNHKYTGLDIIKNYQNKKEAPEFLVISADEERSVIRDGLEVAGYIKKPFLSYEIIVEELRRIKGELI